LSQAYQDLAGRIARIIFEYEHDYDYEYDYEHDYEYEHEHGTVPASALLSPYSSLLTPSSYSRAYRQNVETADIPATSSPGPPSRKPRFSR